MSHITVVPGYHFGEWYAGRGGLEEGCWRVFLFFPKVGETVRLVLCGWPNFAVSKGTRKGGEGQGRVVGQRPERASEKPQQGAPGPDFRPLSPAALSTGLGESLGSSSSSQFRCLLFWRQPASPGC